MDSPASLRQFLPTVIRKWWVLSLWLLPQLLPPISTRGYALPEWGALNLYIITHPVKFNTAGVYPVFQVIPLVLIVALFANGAKVSRLFNAYAGISYGCIALLQSISVSEHWGTAVCTSNLVTFLMLGGIWLRAAFRGQNRLEVRKKSAWQYWPLLLALAAFWKPVNPQTLLPDFNPLYLFISGAGLSFCLATPLYLAVLILSFPRADKLLMAGTALVGFFLGISNLALEFVIIPAYWWIGCLHLPLVILSVYSLFLLFREGMHSEHPVAY